MKTDIILPVSVDTELSAVDALWTLIKQQTKSVKKSLVIRMIQDEVISAEDAERRRQEALVKSSLQQAVQELTAGKAKHNARNLFDNTVRYAHWKTMLHAVIINLCLEFMTPFMVIRAKR